MCVQRSNVPVYEIRLQGYLSPHWSHWFGDMAITHDGIGHTLLTGPVVDQAALHGLLDRAHDLGLPLLSLRCLEAGDDRETGRASQEGEL